MECNAEWFLGQTKWKSSKTFWIHLAYQVSRWQGRVSHPTNQHMMYSHGRSENEPPWERGEIGWNHKPNFVCHVCLDPVPSTTSLSTFQVNEVMLNTPKLENCLAQSTCRSVKRLFFKAKTDFFDPFGARKPLVRPRAERAFFVAGQGWKPEMGVENC